MHDRRIDGAIHTFGNQGGLYKRAMVWWDHETVSLWSQPTGTSIRGPYLGVKLEGIPVAIEPWGTWVDEHPDTVVLDESFGPLSQGGGDPFRGAARRFVIGVTFGDQSKAYYVKAVGETVVVNDVFGGIPLLVYANPRDQAIHIFVRQAEDGPLDFEWTDETLTDVQTGSTWNPALGIAVEGPLTGTALRQVPYSTALDWAWALHNPETLFFPPEP